MAQELQHGERVGGTNAALAIGYGLRRVQGRGQCRPHFVGRAQARRIAGEQAVPGHEAGAGDVAAARGELVGARELARRAGIEQGEAVPAEAPAQLGHGDRRSRVAIERQQLGGAQVRGLADEGAALGGPSLDATVEQARIGVAGAAQGPPHVGRVAAAVPTIDDDGIRADAECREARRQIVGANHTAHATHDGIKRARVKMHGTGNVALGVRALGARVHDMKGTATFLPRGQAFGLDERTIQTHGISAAGAPPGRGLRRHRDPASNPPSSRPGRGDDRRSEGVPR